MYDNEMHLTFAGRSQNEGFARATAGAFASQLDPTIEELADIRTAISEAVTNAIIHGYEDQQGLVHMDCYLQGRNFITVIRDDGKGIENIELARQPFYTSKSGLERSGMGFTVMETFMDAVQVSSVLGEGTTVRMEKHLSGVESDE